MVTGVFVFRYGGIFLVVHRVGSVGTVVDLEIRPVEIRDLVAAQRDIQAHIPGALGHRREHRAVMMADAVHRQHHVIDILFLILVDQLDVLRVGAVKREGLQGGVRQVVALEVDQRTGAIRHQHIAVLRGQRRTKRRHDGKAHQHIAVVFLNTVSRYRAVQAVLVQPDLQP